MEKDVEYEALLDSVSLTKVKEPSAEEVKFKEDYDNLLNNLNNSDNSIQSKSILDFHAELQSSSFFFFPSIYFTILLTTGERADSNFVKELEKLDSKQLFTIVQALTNSAASCITKTNTPSP